MSEWTAWIGLIGAIAGTAVGGVIAYHTAGQQHQHERRVEAHRRLMSAYEEIHQLLSLVTGQVSMLNIGVIGDIGYGTPFTADAVKEKIQAERLRMLIDFYAPTLSDDMERMWQKYAIVTRSTGEVILQKNRTDTWKTKTVEDSTMASIEFGNLSKKAQEKLALLARAIADDGLTTGSSRQPRLRRVCG